MFTFDSQLNSNSCPNGLMHAASDDMKKTKSQQYVTQAIQELFFDAVPRISQASTETASTDPFQKKENPFHKKENPFEVVTDKEKTELSSAYQSSHFMTSQLDKQFQQQSMFLKKPLAVQ